MTAISTSGHPALRRTRTGCPLDAKRCKWHVVGVRCAAPIGTNEIWRAIWLRWLDLGRGRSSGRRFGEVTARPAPQDRRRVRRLATFGTRALGLARSLSQLPKPHQVFYVKSAPICLRQSSRLNVILFAFPDHSRTEKVSDVSCLSRGLRRAPVSDEAPR